MNAFDTGAHEAMTKIARGRFWEWLKTAPKEKLGPAMERVLGTAKPTYLQDTRFNKAVKAVRGGSPDRESLVKNLRWRLKAPFSNDRGLERAGDVAYGRRIKELAKTPTKTLVHETTLPDALNLAKHGPSSGLDHPVPGASGRLEDVGSYFHAAGSEVDKARRGAYARRVAELRGGKPARLELEFPEGLLRRGKNNAYEPVIPKSLWRYARNKRIVEP